MSNSEDYYTTEEAALVLNRAKSTIYKYIQEEKLTPLIDYKKRRVAGQLISKEQVDQLAKEQGRKLGLTVPEAAKFMQLHPSTIHRLIEENKIPYTKGKWRGKNVSFIQQKELEMYLNENESYLKSERLKRRDYYVKEKNLAYFQKFTSSIGLEARLLIAEDRSLQFLFPNTKEVITYEEGIYKYELLPAYSLLFDKTSQTPGLTELRLPRYNAQTFHFLDTYYTHGNISNLYMDYKSDESDIIFFIKDSLLNEISPTLYLYLYEHIKSGSCHYNEEKKTLLFDTEVESFTFHLPRELKVKIKKKADYENVSMQEIMIRLLEKNV